MGETLEGLRRDVAQAETILFLTGALCVGLVVFIVIKALAARKAGRLYQIGYLDGGMLFRGAEVAPGTMLIVAGLFAVLSAAIPAVVLAGAPTWILYALVSAALVALVVVREVRQRRIRARQFAQEEQDAWWSQEGAGPPSPSDHGR